MVDEFVALGWTVVGCARDAEAITQLGQKFGSPHSFHRCDVAMEEDVQALVTAVLARHGPPDLLLNNAAIINPNRPLWEMSAQDIASILDVNIKGTMAVMRHFLPAMLKQGGGVIVNFSSGWGDVAQYLWRWSWAIPVSSRLGT